MENITNPKTFAATTTSSISLTPWYSGYHFCATSFNKAWTQVRASSNPARGLSEILDDESLWKWSRLEIRLNSFHRLIIPQKTIHHRHHFANFSRSVQLTFCIVRNHMNSLSSVTLYRHCSRNDEKFSFFFVHLAENHFRKTFHHRHLIGS